MGVKKQFKRTLLSAAFTLGFAAAGTANAFDWLMAQGTEPVGASAAAKPWGFVQANYQKDFSDPNPSGQFVPAKLLGPNLNSQSMFNLSHAQFGLRGTGFPLDDHVNYFLLVEAGNAATTTTGAGNNGVVVTDASITLNYIEGARVRVGLFKYPGAEEGLQSLASMDYVNFTEMTNFLLLERFPNATFTCAAPCVAPAVAGPVPAGTNYTGNLGPYSWGQLQNGSNINGFSTPVGAFRDTGVQVFDNFQVAKDWKMTYAVMVGNGSGIQWDNVDAKYDTYLYLSTERELDGGAGILKHGFKFFAWNQQGQRLVDVTNDAVANRKLYDRKRSGVGMKYLAKPFRVTAEYIDANGMIFEGPDKPNFYFAAPGNTGNTNSGADAKGKGWYLEGGWFIPSSKWELDARYDTMRANTGRIDEHVFSKWTAGVQYLMNPMSKVTFNYEMRNYDCTASTTQCTNADVNLVGVGRKLSAQVTAAF
jgi:hypothetical protein